jgi:hypothetical protein
MVPSSRSRRLLIAVAGVAVATACGGDDDEPRAAAPLATVTIAYVAATETDAEVAASFPACVAGVEHTHIHPSWRAFARIDLTDAGDRWTVTFSDVPAGVRQRFRINDPNVCSENSTGAVTRSISANGVALTDVVDTPGSGTEPGVAFTAAADGTVTP